MNIKLTITYDGTNYHGWAKQPNNITIEEVIEQKLCLILNIKTIKLISSGRTDAHVHALNQVINFKIDSYQFKLSKLMKNLNKVLPDDIRIKKICEVDEKFNSQYDSKNKTYLYRINLDKNNIFLNNYALQYFKKIDLKKIKLASRLFIGEHNFLSFSISELSDTIRKINWIKIKNKNKEIQFFINGSGFLRAMVRMIISSLLDINENKKNINDIKKLLLNPKKGSSITKAKACGLYLYKVNY